MKIIILNLHYHEKSKSTDWFVEELRHFASVDVIAIDLAFHLLRDILASKPDLIVCWQTEGLVPFILNRGIPAIAAPMADSIGNEPSEYFSVVGQLGSISFSDFIANKFELARKSTFRLKYYPSEINTFDHVNKDILFFHNYRGERHTVANRLSDLIKGNRSKVMQVLGSDYAHTTYFHRHLQLDNYNETSKGDYDSSYFQDVQDLNSLLKRSRFFICPRESEGIGFSTLRAISFGAIPIGINGPGNSEFHGNGGISVDPANLEESFGASCGISIF